MSESDPDDSKKSRTPGSPGSHGRGKGPPPPPIYTPKATGDAARNFDFLAARPPGKRTNFIESIGHLVKSALGGGVVSIHEAYWECGLWTAFVLNFFLGFLVAYLMYVLAKCAQIAYGRTQTAKLSYPDLAQCTFEISKFPAIKKRARVFRYLVDATIMIDLFGSCCCYQVLIANTIRQILKHYAGTILEVRIILVCLVIPCILICMILTLKYLAPFSIVANIMIAVAAIATVVYGSQNAIRENRKPTDMRPFTHIGGLLNFMGVCVFSMEGVGATLPVENNMQNPQRVGQVVIIGEIFIVGIVMTVGFFGCWGYASAVKAPVTLNFPRQAFPLFLKVGLACMVYVTFALNFWVPFELAWVYLKKRHVNSTRIKTVQRLYRAVFVIGITIISTIFPKVTKLIGVIGAFCLTNMGFIYPSIIQLLLEWEDPGLGKMKWRLIRFIVIFTFAVILMITATIYNIFDMIDSLYGSKKDDDD